jgi:hypothetical protein
MIFDKEQIAKKKEGRAVQFTDHSSFLSEDDTEHVVVPPKKCVERNSNASTLKRAHARASLNYIEDISFGLPFARKSVKTSHEDLRKSLANGDDDILDDIAIVTRDFALVLAMERTLFAALNNSWLTAVAGVALMSVGKDDRATRGGICIVVFSIIGVFVAVCMHCVRIWQIRNDKALHFYSTIGWSVGVGILSFVALILELYFGTVYPYHSRSSTSGL